MHLKQPYGPMLQILVGGWGSILSKPWVAKQGGWDGDCATAEKHNDPKQEESELFKVANGTGPYKLDRWASGEQISLVRNDNYWLKEPLWDGGPSGPAKIARIVIKYVKEWGTRFAAFKAGDADILNVDPQYISQVEPLVKETCAYGQTCAPTHADGFARVYTRLPPPANGITAAQSAGQHHRRQQLHWLRQARRQRHSGGLLCRYPRSQGDELLPRLEDGDRPGVQRRGGAELRAGD